jgi:hypothetical protein
VIGTIVNGDLEIGTGIAGNNTFNQGFFDTFFNSGNKIGRNNSALDTIDKLDTFAAVFGFDSDLTVSILTMTAGLMNIFTLTLGIF